MHRQLRACEGLTFFCFRENVYPQVWLNSYVTGCNHILLCRRYHITRKVMVVHRHINTVLITGMLIVKQLWFKYAMSGWL